jgi:arylsulfatase A-like enzyme
MKFTSLVLIGLLFYPTAVTAAEESTPVRRPNFLFIVVDDQSPFDLKAYNPRTTLDTPHIDRLAAEGMVLERAYQMGSFSGAVCTPSRHMIMCGRTLWHLPIGPTSKRNALENLDEQTIPAVFNRAGYVTVRTCKKGNSYEAANKHFKIRHDATKRGDTPETGSAWHAERVLDYLNQRKAEGDRTPFLIHFGFSHPHDIRNGTPELLAKYGATNHTDKDSLPMSNSRQPALPANYLPKHPFPHGHDTVRDETEVSGVWDRRDAQTIRNERGRLFACSENIDQQIGRVLKKLEETGELDNTFIIYTSDHGIAVGRHGLQGKQNLYDHTWRVPYIVKGPGIRPGSRAVGNIYLLDTLATLCELAGIPASTTNEGVSFKSVLIGTRESVRDVLYGAYCGGDKPGMRCVRQGDWKLIQYDVGDGATHETQLFHLARNPDELLKEHHEPGVVSATGTTPTADQVNLAGVPKHAAKLAEMEAVLLGEMRRLQDPYRLWNQPADDLPALPRRERSGNRACPNP